MPNISIFFGKVQIQQNLQKTFCMLIWRSKFLRVLVSRDGGLAPRAWVECQAKHPRARETQSRPAHADPLISLIHPLPIYQGILNCPFFENPLWNEVGELRSHLVQGAPVQPFVRPEKSSFPFPTEVTTKIANIATTLGCTWISNPDQGRPGCVQLWTFNLGK